MKIEVSVLKESVFEKFSKSELLCIDLELITDSAVVDHPGVSGGYPLYKQVFICPRCLLQWAWLELDQEEYQINPVSCTICFRPNDLYPVPGSILENSLLCESRMDDELLKILPEDLLKREFFLTLKALA